MSHETAQSSLYAISLDFNTSRLLSLLLDSISCVTALANNTLYLKMSAREICHLHCNQLNPHSFLGISCQLHAVPFIVFQNGIVRIMEPTGTWSFLKTKDNCRLSISGRNFRSTVTNTTTCRFPG